jgi:hypothetical protein
MLSMLADKVSTTGIDSNNLLLLKSRGPSFKTVKTHFQPFFHLKNPNKYY